jgi:hypothetical protein
MSIENILQNSIVLITSTETENKSFGTGFVFWQENNDSYVLTCAHVIEEVGKDSICINSLEKFELIACGNPSNIDLAILKITNLQKEALYPCNMFGQKSINFQISGFSRLDMKKGQQLLLGENIEGTTKDQILLTKDLLNGWHLDMINGCLLQGGYSGSPIVDKQTGKVFAVATFAKTTGESGYAISISHLLKIWNDPPSKLRDLLNKNTLKYKELCNTDCYVLIEIKKSDKKSFYSVEAWIYSPEEFQKIYTKEDVSIKEIEDKSIIFHQFIVEIIDQIEIAYHGKFTLEFILPIELFSYPIEQWTNEDNDPIGVLYPIIVRSQERFRHLKLQRFWKPIQPDLNELLLNKTYWLEQPHAKTFYSKLKEHICFAMVFNPCHVEENFLKEMLKYGVAVGLWAHKCQDFCLMKQQVNNEIFNNKSLCNLPTALKDFRTTQWEKEQYNYHLTLFWDDKDRIPPSYQLQIPD